MPSMALEVGLVLDMDRVLDPPSRDDEIVRSGFRIPPDVNEEPEPGFLGILLTWASAPDIRMPRTRCLRLYLDRNRTGTANIAGEDVDFGHVPGERHGVRATAM